MTGETQRRVYEGPVQVAPGDADPIDVVTARFEATGRDVPLWGGELRVRDQAALLDWQGPVKLTFPDGTEAPAFLERVPGADGETVGATDVVRIVGEGPTPF